MKQKCNQCGKTWDDDWYPLCPQCNHAVLQALESLDTAWLNSPTRAENDVLNVESKPGFLHVYISDLYTGEIKWEDFAYPNSEDTPDV